ncbi:MAG: DUF3891 family protein [Chloroflexi bacterium]|nr:DUF3891 family protein [Chloroflexota bacterium]
MFESKVRPIVIPQAEHGKLAGALAFLWGNPQFDQPAIDFSSFVLGVGLHDRGYGFQDAAAIGGISETAWLQVTRQGFYMAIADPAAELIIKLHLQRLVSYGDAAPRQALFIEMEAAIQQHIADHQLSKTEFLRIDRITNFCDTLAFDFCFEKPTTGAVQIFARNNRNEQVSLHYTIHAGEIMIDPWPFSVESYTGYIVGYQQQDYPIVIEPVMVPYRIRQSSALEKQAMHKG